MQWIKILDDQNVRAQLPKDRPFFALWKEAFALLDFDEDEDIFYVSYLPVMGFGGFRLNIEREAHITHFCKLEFPKDC